MECEFWKMDGNLFCMLCLLITEIVSKSTSEMRVQNVLTQVRTSVHDMTRQTNTGKHVR